MANGTVASAYNPFKISGVDEPCQIAAFKQRRGMEDTASEVKGREGVDFAGTVRTLGIVTRGSSRDKIEYSSPIARLYQFSRVQERR